jgi:hypothetical protein
MIIFTLKTSDTSVAAASVSASGHPNSGSTANFTLAPNNGAGLITTSFTALEDEASLAILNNYFNGSSRSRQTQLIDHESIVGHYAFSKATKKLIFALLLAAGINEDSGTEEEIFVGTISNLTSTATQVVIPYLDVTGSTIRIVTQTFADQLPPGWKGKGTPFQASTVKAAAIKSYLPTSTTRTKYVIIRCPNSFPIKPGAVKAYKGSADDTMVGAFEEQNGLLGKAWLIIMGTLDPGVLPFDAALQKAVHDNMTTLDSHCPKIGSKAALATHPHVSMASPPLEVDDDHPMKPALDRQANHVNTCLKKNFMSQLPPAVHQAPIQQLDIQSMTGGDAIATPTTSAVNVDRHESKLRLFCAGFNAETNTIILHDLRDPIKSTLHHNKTTQTESFSNQLSARSDKLADSLDRVNNLSEWPDYSNTP